MHYSLDSRDANSLLRSVGSALKILAVSGATYLTTLHAGAFGLERFATNSSRSNPLFPPENAPPSVAPSVSKTATIAAAASAAAAANPSPISAELVEELAAASVSVGLPCHGVGLFSAHQMGTSLMGSDPRESVVDCDGESWDVDHLFVMDASVFPTASGANPMTTTLAIAHLLATRLATRLNAQDQASTTSAAAANNTSSTAKATTAEGADIKAAAAALLEAARSERRQAAAKVQKAAKRRDDVTKWALRAVVVGSVVAVARAVHHRKK